MGSASRISKRLVLSAHYWLPRLVQIGISKVYTNEFSLVEFIHNYQGQRVFGRRVGRRSSGLGIPIPQVPLSHVRILVSSDGGRSRSNQAYGAARRSVVL